MSFVKNAKIGLLIIFLFSLQGMIKDIFPKPDIRVSKESSSINFSKEFSKFIQFGHGRFLGAYLWVSTLLESDIEHHKKKDSNSWMYHRFNTISIYDPLFYENYLYGGQYLSIIKDDIDGASRIYEKGLLKYPKDFRLNYHAGFHFYFEANNREKAIAAYEALIKSPNAIRKFPHLPRILAKLKAEAGDLKAAFNQLHHIYQGLGSNDRLKERFHGTLYSIKAKMDLKCLNKVENKNCEKKDFDGNFYLKKEGSYYSARSLSKIYLKGINNL